MLIREIRKEDNPTIARIITESMMEFEADPDTTILGDPVIHSMSENYKDGRSIYYIVELDGKIEGGCGIKQVEGTEENICELQRMFLSEEVRGYGIGKILLEICLSDAKAFAFKKVYIETLSRMTNAIKLYEKSGFRQIEQAVGNTGHPGCNVYMIYDLPE